MLRTILEEVGFADAAIDLLVDSGKNIQKDQDDSPDKAEYSYWLAF